jgi:ribokinase
MKGLTIGGAMVDTIAIVEDGLIEQMSIRNAGKTFLLLEQGSKTEASCISTHCGGGAINAAVSLARLGLTVSTLAKIGSDTHAKVVKSTLAAEGVSDKWLKSTRDAPTGASAVISAHDRDAAIFTFRGANTLLSPTDLRSEMFDVDLVYVSPLSGTSAEILPDIVKHASRRKTFVAVNPGIRQITNLFTTIKDSLPGFDILAVNRLEAETLVRESFTELSGSENRTLRSLAATTLVALRNSALVSRHDVAKALISGLKQIGARSVLLTDGRHGAYASRDGETVFCPGLEVPVVGTAGAGDAFYSTFAAFLAAGGASSDALLAAAVNASSVVRFADAQSGLLSRSDLEKEMCDARKRLTMERWVAD